MPKANTKEVVTFDQQIINAVVKQVLTPEKIEALAISMAPAIEKQFAKAATKFVEGMFEDNWRLADILNDDKVIQHAMLVGLRKAMGVDPKVATMVKAKDSKRTTKANVGIRIPQNQAADPMRW